MATPGAASATAGAAGRASADRPLHREETALASTLKTALVTGAGSGIGRSITATLADMGLRVALVGRDREKLERARAGPRAGPRLGLRRPCDISDRFAVKAVVDQVLTAFGGIDVLVCNAGTNVKNRSLESLDPADWDRMIATNLTGSFNLVHAVLPSMRRQKNGLVIQICSISGMRASTLGGAGYSASKFGQSALGICLGREEGPQRHPLVGDLSGRGRTRRSSTPGPSPSAPERRAVDPPARGRRRGRPVPGRAPPACPRARAGHQADRR